MRTNKFNDRIDDSIKISLYEYGFIRNSYTGKTIFCLNFVDNHEIPEDTYSNWKPDIKTTFISFNDVNEYLQEIEPGFYDFIGESQENVLANLDNKNLSTYIHSVNQYDGYFKQEFYGK